MLNTEVHALLDVTVTDNLVDDDSDGIGSDVVHNSSSSEVAKEISIRKNLYKWRHTHDNTYGAYPFVARR